MVKCPIAFLHSWFRPGRSVSPAQNHATPIGISYTVQHAMQTCSLQLCSEKLLNLNISWYALCTPELSFNLNCASRIISSSSVVCMLEQKCLWLSFESSQRIAVHDSFWQRVPGVWRWILESTPGKVHMAHYRRPFATFLLHWPVSVDVWKLNCFAELTEPT